MKFIKRMKSIYYYLDGSTGNTYADVNKLVHRLDGPALEIIYENGIIVNRYFLYDKFLGENLSPEKWEIIKNKFLKECVFK